MPRRRLSIPFVPLLVSIALLGLAALGSQGGEPVPPPGLRAVEMTFLKSLPGERDRLRQFIVRNWFAMDAVARERGLMSAYTVLDTATDEGDWNLVVVVTYPDARGYEGIAAEFEAIRRAHQTILIDGKGLRELGAVVGSKRTFENPADGGR